MSKTKRLITVRKCKEPVPLPKIKIPRPGQTKREKKYISSFLSKSHPLSMPLMDIRETLSCTAINTYNLGHTLFV
jgi:hypothetical protein